MGSGETAWNSRTGDVSVQCRYLNEKDARRTGPRKSVNLVKGAVSEERQREDFFGLGVGPLLVCAYELLCRLLRVRLGGRRAVSCQILGTLTLVHKQKHMILIAALLVIAAASPRR